MTKAYVETKNGIPTLMIDGKPFAGSAVTVASNRDGVLKLNEDYYRRLGESGIRMFFLICDTEFTKPDGYALFKEEAEAIVRAVPDAWIIPRVGLQPSRAWTDAHPDAMVGWSDGSKHHTMLRTESYTAEIGCYALYAESWRQDAGKALAEFIKRADGESFGSRIIGYFLAAGSSSEWLPLDLSIGSGDEPYYGTDETFRRHFEGYLQKKYGEAVPAEIPDNTARHYILKYDNDVIAMRGGRPHDMAVSVPVNGAGEGVFPDIEEKGNVLDFYMAWGDAVAESVLHFAGIVKEQFPDKLTGAFFGYTRGVHQCGHLAGLSRILRDGRLDFCAAPGDYENRAPGGWEALRTPFDSYRFHNTLFFAEDDTRTHKENKYYRSAYGVYNEADAIQVMKRNFGKNICGGNLGWWFDQHHGGGRYDSPGILALMKKQAAIAEKVENAERYKRNEIALVYDAESRVAASHDTSHQSVTLMKNFSLGRIGAPYDEFLLEDMESEAMPDYKLYIFAAAYLLDDKKREIVHKKLQKNGAAALWLYGAGYMNPEAEKKLDCENIRQLTGFSVEKKTDYPYDSFFRVCGGHEITKDLRRNHVYGKSDVPRYSNQGLHTYEPRPYACPLFYIADEGAEIFGRYCEEELPAAGIKAYNGFTSIWCGAKFLQPDFIRAMARFAGCHIYSGEGDVVYAGSGFVTVHAASSGQKTLYLPTPATLCEVYEEKCYGENKTEFSFHMEEGDTKMFAVS